MKNIDLRSDTITRPTQEMRDAMYRAVVGDDVYEEDPTVKELEATAARMMGKEAALFVSSGTQANQLAIMSHTRRGNEVIAADTSHVVGSEVGGAAVISGVTVRTARTTDGRMEAADIAALIRTPNIHYPETGLVCVENATFIGTVVPVGQLRAVAEACRERGVPVHLDGARIFNASIALGVSAAEIAACADTAMFCLSKGLCAPIGSMLSGSAEFIRKARKNRKMLGGGMRQAGVIAAAGIVALEKMIPRLAEDHRNARVLAEGIGTLRGIDVDLSRVQTNMVYADIQRTGLSKQAFAEGLLARGIRCNPRPGTIVRFVTSHEVSRDDILYAVEQMREMLA